MDGKEFGKDVDNNWDVARCKVRKPGRFTKEA